MLVRRIIGWSQRWIRARRLGIPYVRDRSWKAPTSICLDRQKVKVLLPHDQGTEIAFKDILLNDCYELESLPKNIASVVDIGAHVGLFSLAARIRFRQAEVHAYEPNPQMLPFLAQQSTAGQFSVFSEAVGFEGGQVSIKPGEDSVHARVDQDSESNIPCISFAEAIRRVKNEPILVKLDCEGSEWEILRDAITWQRVEYLTMEYHLWAGYTLIELGRQIESLGFVIKSVTNTEKTFGILIAQRI
jgi:FkbM family methyltransferase